MKKYKGEYNTQSRRLKNWDYSDNGYYFVTICIKDMVCCFGEVINDKMKLSNEGLIANNCLIEVEKHYPFVKTEGFVVMPNHIHVILIINKPSNENAINRVSTNVNGGFSGKNNPMITHGISKIIRWYKGRVTFEIRKINPRFAWQANYHDHIIRNEKSYQKIAEYISNNPLKWSLDRFNPINKTY